MACQLGVTAVRGYGFRRDQRLRNSRQFDRVFRGRGRYNARYFIINYRRNNGESDRLGLTVSRKHGGAVARNRIKRILRELFRLNPPGGEPCYDLVVRPLSGFIDAEFDELQRQWRTALAAIKVRKRNI